MSSQDSNSTVIPPFTDKFRCVILFGPPGAGKGTVSKTLSQAGSMLHVSSGDIFRGMAPESPAGQLTQSFIKKGELVPDEVTIEIWRYYMSGLIATNRCFPKQQFVLLDGLPRTVGQAKALDPLVEVQSVVVLDMANDDVLIDRLKRRAKIEGRVDDMKDEVLAKRLDVYKTETAQVLSHYPDELITRVNADQTPMQVLRDILNPLAETLTCQSRPLAMNT